MIIQETKTAIGFQKLSRSAIDIGNIPLKTGPILGIMFSIIAIIALETTINQNKNNNSSGNNNNNNNNNEVFVKQIQDMEQQISVLMDTELKLKNEVASSNKQIQELQKANEEQQVEASNAYSAMESDFLEMVDENGKLSRERNDLSEQLLKVEEQLEQQKLQGTQQVVTHQSKQEQNAFSFF